MQRPPLDPPATHAATHSVTHFKSVSPAGILPACVIHPSVPSGKAPLVALHGISRNAADLAELLAPEAETSGRPVIVPHFGDDDWPNFQRPDRRSRPDLALLALLALLEPVLPGLTGPVDLFGHSGGAQLAHRFAMLYPHRVGRLHLAAAGWYCLPDASMPHPYGLAAGGGRKNLPWARRHTQALPGYLALPVHVYVGSEDLGRDDSLRKTPALDRIQGRTRLDRARHYVASFRGAAAAHGIAPDIDLTCLPGVTHDVAEAITKGGLAGLVMAGPQRLCCPA